MTEILIIIGMAASQQWIDDQVAHGHKVVCVECPTYVPHTKPFARDGAYACVSDRSIFMDEVEAACKRGPSNS